MLGSLSTLSYADPQAQAQIENAFVANPKAVLVDTRLTPWCRWSEDWRQTALKERYGKRYVWKGDLLGNLNHGRGGPIQLADEVAGLAWVVTWLEKGWTLMLLCGCSSYENCHRKVIYDKVVTQLGDALTLYPPGQRVLTPRGPGTVDPAIPLTISLQRHRYAVLLDGWNGPMQYFFPSDLQSYDLVQAQLFAA